MCTSQDLERVPFGILQQYVEWEPKRHAEVVVEEPLSVSAGPSKGVGTLALYRGGQLLHVPDAVHSHYPKDKLKIQRLESIAPLKVEEQDLIQLFVEKCSVKEKGDDAATGHKVKETRYSTPNKRPIVTATSSRVGSSSQDNANAERDGALFVSPQSIRQATSARLIDISVAVNKSSTPNKLLNVFSPGKGVPHGCEEDAKKSSSAMEGNRGSSRSSSHEEEVVHLIVLQHGFLGNSFDMRLLHNAMVAELPSCTHVSEEFFYHHRHS